MYSVKTRKPIILGESRKVFSDALPPPMNRIPPIIFKEIFCYLKEVDDFCNLRRVCNLFKRIASDDLFWNSIFDQSFPIKKEQEEEQKNKKEEKSGV